MADSYALVVEGTSTPISGALPGRFDALNTGTTHLLLRFTGATPGLVTLGPGERATMASSGSEVVAKASYYATADPNPTGRYRAWARGLAVQQIPLASYADSQTRIADAITANTYTSTGSIAGKLSLRAGPSYGAMTWPMDYLVSVEGAGDAIPTQNIRDTLDIYLACQLTAVNNYCPRGAIPDGVTQNGTVYWGTEVLAGLPPELGLHMRNNTMHDLTVAQLAKLVGIRENYDAGWVSYFGSIKSKLEAAYNAVMDGTANGLGMVAYDAATGLIAQWDDNPSAMWSTLDNIHWLSTGENGGQKMSHVGTSVFAYDFCAAMQDCCHEAGDSDESVWSARADGFRDAIRAVVNPTGYLCWTHNGEVDKAAIDVTAHAVWSRILTDEQCIAASNWLAGLYAADKAAGVDGQAFMFRAGGRGALRACLKSEDAQAGFKVFPKANRTTTSQPPTGTPYSKYTTNPLTSFGDYQNGGYWFIATGWVVNALNYANPDVAAELAGYATTDMLADASASYEYIHANGTKVDGPYMASTAAIAASVGSPATTQTFDVGQLTASVQGSGVRVSSTVPMTGPLQRREVVV
jgi:hypothetical protein